MNAGRELRCRSGAATTFPDRKMYEKDRPVSNTFVHALQVSLQRSDELTFLFAHRKFHTLCIERRHIAYQAKALDQHTSVLNCQTGASAGALRLLAFKSSFRGVGGGQCF